jgi:hypothetical protein
MATQESVSRIAKILARATSSNEHEAAQAIKSAYARMQKEHITFDDVLRLPIVELYQDTLVRLLDHILDSTPNLAPTERRKIYNEYLMAIVVKFQDEREPEQKTTHTQSTKQSSNDESSREEQARRYRERYGQNDSQQQQTGQGSQQSRSSEEPQQEQNHKSGDDSRTFSIFGKTFSFSSATFFSGMSGAFGRGSFFHACLNRPLASLHLFYASFIFGIIAAIACMVFLGLVYALIPFPIPNVSFVTVFGAIATFFIVIKARYFWLAGWFR